MGERPRGAAAYGGDGFKERAAVSGERPTGAASCKQQHNQVSCQTPLPHLNTNNRFAAHVMNLAI